MVRRFTMRAALFCVLAASSSAAAQRTVVAPMPFAAGELAVYKAGWGIFGSAGTGTMSLSMDTLRGDSTLHAVLAIRGGIPGLRIDERLESWMDRATLASRRFVQRTRYPRFSRDRLRDFFSVDNRWTGHTNQRSETGDLATTRPLDEIGFIFVARAESLVVGEELVYQDFWKADANPVRLKVLRRQVVKVPAGTYNTIVVQPIIKTAGMFAEKGEAEVYISEGPARELVMLRAKLSIGTLVLQLEQFTPGQASPK